MGKHISVKLMSMFFFIAALICMFAVVAVLATGLIAMSRGGDFNEKYGNKLMQARVYLQGLTLVLLAASYFTK